MKILSVFFLALFFIIFNKESLAEKTNKGTGSGVSSKKKNKKGSGEPLIDVHDLISDMIKKEEELVEVNKRKSKYKLATSVLAGLLGVVSTVLLGGVGLVLYNTEKGRHPFKIGSSDPADNANPDADSESNGEPNAVPQVTAQDVTPEQPQGDDNNLVSGTEH
ncbi:malaria protein EXP-1 [Plasmodium falciparum Palo Alto/Uganda]|uniref:Malaria protein EXP-1 n=3 Tax=Plasmodium falciparum TaxID=5833 RepID=W4IU23_PLAFP|nr:malaria protein EXP-1 [Plasmodium falciparum Palo Alto/Uganda]ETW60580.1 malaria protein EXP-1 [Plasmodium falciparum CAMP/Malaysia]EUR70159.1 malaria protein EXP-1 [Plasmodium falciparum 7G8]